MKRLPPPLPPHVLRAYHAEIEAAEAAQTVRGAEPSQAELDAAVDDDSCVEIREGKRVVARWPHGMAIAISFSLEPLERGLRKLAAELEAKAAAASRALPDKRRRRSTKKTTSRR